MRTVAPKLLEWIGFDKSLETQDRFTYIISGFCIGLVLIFLPFFIFYVKSALVSWTTTASLAILIVVLPLLKSRCFLAAKSLMIAGLFYQVTALTFFWFPLESNFNYFYFIVTPITFFIFNYRVRKERVLIILYGILAVILLLASELLNSSLALIPLTPVMMDFFSALSVLSTIGSMTIVFLFYASNLSAIHTELRLQANTDSLTNTYNRRALFREGQKLFQQAGKRKAGFSFLLLDIDHFKKVNDRYGHPAGDAILVDLSRLISGKVRINDLFSRYGGEEFAIILRDSSGETCRNVAENLRKTVENHAFTVPGGESIRLTISIGVESYSPAFTDFAALVLSADKALYQAKEGGRNRVEVGYPRG